LDDSFDRLLLPKKRERDEYDDSTMKLECDLSSITVNISLVSYVLYDMCHADDRRGVSSRRGHLRIKCRTLTAIESVAALLVQFTVTNCLLEADTAKLSSFQPFTVLCSFHPHVSLSSAHVTKDFDIDTVVRQKQYYNRIS